MSGKETLNLEGITPESIEAVDEGLQLNQEEPQEEQVELELTFDEKKKYLRAMRNKEEFPMPVTDEEIDVLTDDEIEKIKDFAKLRERKAIYKFVYRKKTVTDDDVKDLTDEEVSDLTAQAMVMSRHLTYNPKKNFGENYKKKRQNKNKIVKASRRANR